MVLNRYTPVLLGSMAEAKALDAWAISGIIPSISSAIQLCATNGATGGTCVLGGTETFAPDGGAWLEEEPPVPEFMTTIMLGMTKLWGLSEQGSGRRKNNRMLLKFRWEDTMLYRAAIQLHQEIPWTYAWLPDCLPTSLQQSAFILLIPIRIWCLSQTHDATLKALPIPGK